MQTKNFDPDYVDSYFFVDSEDMVAMKNPDWKPDDDNGKRDSIGRTFFGFFAWAHTPFIWAVRSCFVLRQKRRFYYQGFRHPSLVGSPGKNDFSRDHLFYGLLLLKMADQKEALASIVKRTRLRISDRFFISPDLYFWARAIQGRRAFVALFYLAMIPTLFLSVLWNKFIFLLAGFEDEVEQKDFEPVRKPLNRKKKFLRKLLYPVYTLLQVGFMFYVLPDSWAKRIGKRIGLLGAPRHNYLIKLLFDGKVSREEVDSYRSMSGFRWTSYLSELDDRGIAVITDEALLEKNVLDVDLLRTLYSQVRESKS